ncbi:MAG: TolC family protein [Arcticibacter sp.]
MKKRNKIILLLFILCVAQISLAQDTLRLSHKEFVWIVKQYHPLAFRYRLENDIAKAEVLQAKGSFDPVLQVKEGSKTIDGIDYYEESHVGIEIPTWYGIELNGSYKYLEGERLNNSATPGGLYQFGLTIPLAKGLIYDSRRALLEQARHARQVTAAEQQVLTNELLRDAENAYWQWVKQYELYQVQKQAVDINKKRLQLIQKTYNYGEKAAIDTTEAISQLRGFELEQQEAYLQYVKATMELSLYLWKDNQKPFELDRPMFPAVQLTSSEAYSTYPALIERLNALPVNSHLSVVYYQQKQNILESEQRLKWQSFLPKVDLTYNFLNKEHYHVRHLPLFQNNYQYGIKLEVPLFLRQARADYRQAKLKVTQNELDTDIKRQEINTKIVNYTTEVVNYIAQIDLATKNVANYERLLLAEEMKYDNGESSLFLINSRENKLIEAREKAIELRMKFLKSYNELKLITESYDGI